MKYYVITAIIALAAAKAKAKAEAQSNLTDRNQMRSGTKTYERNAIKQTGQRFSKAGYAGSPILFHQ